MSLQHPAGIGVSGSHKLSSHRGFVTWVCAEARAPVLGSVLLLVIATDVQPRVSPALERFNPKLSQQETPKCCPVVSCGSSDFRGRC